MRNKPKVVLLRYLVIDIIRLNQARADANSEMKRSVCVVLSLSYFFFASRFRFSLSLSFRFAERRAFVFASGMLAMITKKGEIHCASECKSEGENAIFPIVLRGILFFVSLWQRKSGFIFRARARVLRR
jgi:hypothetical protein